MDVDDDDDNNNDDDDDDDDGKKKKKGKTKKSKSSGGGKDGGKCDDKGDSSAVALVEERGARFPKTLTALILRLKRWKAHLQFCVGGAHRLRLNLVGGATALVTFMCVIFCVAF
jgi:hypothetical protein